MNLEEIINLCQWDFLTFGEALSISPDNCDGIRYIKFEELRHSSNLNSLISLPPIFEIRISTEPFGFYSWMPTNENDRALVLEQKIYPKPWTDYEPENKIQIEFICSFIDSILREHGLLTGVACVANEKNSYKFLVMIRSGIFVNFWITEEQLHEMENEKKYLCSYLGFISNQMIDTLFKIYEKN